MVSLSKPLFVSKIESFGTLKKSSPAFGTDGNDDHKQKGQLAVCKAYEADKSTPIEDSQSPSETGRRLKIGIYFATWWALNVIFNIYNKKVLNAYPFPWLTSTLSLAAGSLIMFISWALRIAETPKTDLEFWKALFPVSNSFWILLNFYCLVHVVVAFIIFINFGHGYICGFVILDGLKK